MKFVASLAVALFYFIAILVVSVLSAALISWMFLSRPPQQPIMQIINAFIIGAAFYCAKVGWTHGSKWADERTLKRNHLVGK